jgi:transcriptional regulator with XRE-family HTH domain
LGIGILSVHRKWVASPYYRAIIDTVKAARLEAGISQRQMAQRLGKPPSFVNKIELIERRIDLLEFIAFANAMGIPPAVLMDRLVQALPETFEI